jgi:uncharacterized protein YkwD
MSPSANATRVRPGVEELESRYAPAGVEPTPLEQEFLERLNDARANPALYGQMIGVDLSGVAPSQPLAFDVRLVAAARGHSMDMAIRNYFDHVTPEGITPQQRLLAAGFRAISSGESIAFFEGPTLTPSDPNNFNSPLVRDVVPPSFALALLITDSGMPELGHRRHLLAIDAFFKKHNLVGVGYAFQDSTDAHGFAVTSQYFTIDTGFDGRPRSYLTGSIFADQNGNGLYDVGEGLAGVRIHVAGAGTVQDFDSGGYTVAVPHPGTYRVTATGGGLPHPMTRTVHVGSHNVRLNFIIP